MSEEIQKTFASPNYMGIDKPFFAHDPDANIEQIKEESDLIMSKLKELCLHKDIENFFLSNQSLQEIYIKNWSLMSLDAIIERYNICKKDNINIYDIGFTYKGMGHVKVAFYDPKLEKIFYRIDGGANGYDRIDNYNKLKTYSSETNNNPGLTFQDFLNEIQEFKNETGIIF